jgi:dTDP-4-dehydrorhamnose reductase
MIWLTGCRGMLGQDVARELVSRGMRHVETDMDCDITSPEAVAGFAREKKLNWIVNCSAYTAVDRAEEEETRADLVNATGPQNLGRLSAEVGARIIHISTDYVFDGAASSPYREDEPIAPRGAYGRTKAHGEALLAEATSRHFIVRTAWLYGVGGRNFVSTMLKLMNERDEITVVSDQRGSPTYSRDLASAIGAIIEADSHSFGIYHYTNEGETTWFEFARSILELGIDRGKITRKCAVRPILAEDYPSSVARPKYSVLSKERIKRTLGIEIPTWQDGLKRFFSELEENKD